MIQVGIAGIGFMGMIHYLAYRQTAGVKVAAICTRDEKKLAGDWREIKGNFGPPGEQMDLSDVRRYQSLADLVADSELDVIDVCLSPNMHPQVTVDALSAGKHVFCEKPIALTSQSCQTMLDAASGAGKQLLIGHILPLLPEYSKAIEVIRSGEYGKLLGGSFKRVISDPLWIKDFYDPDKVGGPLVDLHVHDAHFIRLLFGMPRSVTSQGRMRGPVVEYCTTLFDFEDPSLVVSSAGGVINQQGRGFTHGFEIHLENATLQYESAIVGDQPELLMPLTIFDNDGKTVRPDVGDGDMVRAFERETAEVVRAISSGQPSPILAGDLAADAVLLCHKQTESVKRRERVDIS